MAKFIEVKDLVFEYGETAALDFKAVQASESDCKTNMTVEEDFDSTQSAINHVSFEIDKGSYVAVAGANGSGKSTLARCLNGLLIPTSGEILVDGMDTGDDSLIWDIRKKIGMVFQNPDNQIVSSIVEDEVAFGPENLGVPHPELRRRVDEALKSVGMYEFRTREAHKLSGGQKQRVAIAGAVAMRPSCIIFDEPTAMLDPEGRVQVMKVIRELNKQGITIILITHFMEEVAEADRAIVMKNGRLLSDSTPEELFSDKGLIQEAGLEIPAAVELKHRLQELGVKLADDIINKDELVAALCQ